MTLGCNVCHKSCLEFGQRILTYEEVRGKAVLEVGAQDVNGSLRSHVESLEPRSYVGVDLAPGKGVDVICPAAALAEKFGHRSQDIVLCTETLEHIEGWQAAIVNMKHVLRENGLILLTTRSLGYPLHGYPYDFWRFEPQDLAQAFSDFFIIALEPDKEAPGVFLAGRRYASATPPIVPSLAVYSVVLGRRVTTLSALQSIGLQLSVRFGHWIPARVRKVLGGLVFGGRDAERG